MSNFPAFRCSGEWRGRHWCMVKNSIMRKTLTIFYIYAEGEQQEESGTGEGAKRAIGNLPSQPVVTKVKSFYVNWKCKWNSNG